MTNVINSTRYTILKYCLVCIVLISRVEIYQIYFKDLKISNYCIILKLEQTKKDLWIKNMLTGLSKEMKETIQSNAWKRSSAYSGEHHQISKNTLFNCRNITHLLRTKIMWFQDTKLSHHMSLLCESHIFLCLEIGTT